MLENRLASEQHDMGSPPVCFFAGTLGSHSYNTMRAANIVFGVGELMSVESQGMLDRPGLNQELFHTPGWKGAGLPILFKGDVAMGLTLQLSLRRDFLLTISHLFPRKTLSLLVIL